ncbi:MAG: VanZ family protein [Clostridia bacterium]|nr:VanZ family protein [Clostridia bacterium]MBO7288966.1 VanZ family protein [Clostridia bacterium]
MKRKIIFLLLTIMWMALIFWFSSKTASDSSVQSFSLTEWFFELFISNPSARFLDIAENIIRKLAHFTEYFILGGLVFGTVKEFMSK